jgi:hypothetical protein
VVPFFKWKAFILANTAKYTIKNVNKTNTKLNLSIPILNSTVSGILNIQIDVFVSKLNTPNNKIRALPKPGLKVRATILHKVNIIIIVN